MPSRGPVRPATAAATLPAMPPGWCATAWSSEADNSFSKRAANIEALEVRYSLQPADEQTSQAPLEKQADWYLSQGVSMKTMRPFFYVCSRTGHLQQSVNAARVQV